MLIRIILRALPLFFVGIFTLAVYLVEPPLERAQDPARQQGQRLAWSHGLVKCPDPAGNLPLAACMAGNTPRNPPPVH